MSAKLLSSHRTGQSAPCTGCCSAESPENLLLLNGGGGRLFVIGHARRDTVPYAPQRGAREQQRGDRLRARSTCGCGARAARLASSYLHPNGWRNREDGCEPPDAQLPTGTGVGGLLGRDSLLRRELLPDSGFTPATSTTGPDLSLSDIYQTSNRQWQSTGRHLLRIAAAAIPVRAVRAERR